MKGNNTTSSKFSMTEEKQMNKVTIKKLGAVLIGLMLISMVLVGVAGADEELGGKTTYQLADGVVLPENDEPVFPINLYDLKSR